MKGAAFLPALLACGLALGCRGSSTARLDYRVSTGGDPERGEAVIRRVGCGSCHTIPGVRGASGVVGPPLYFFSRRTMIAGELPNTPENLVRWLRDPTGVERGTAMPNLGLTDPQARDVAAYLYTLE